ncbi:hypothetical protein [Lacihabitans lacunae]|uniref:Uncharacterized protein n=1 Tax=Lacihabitans lacunae TaxID=1028214 RepID=A0ABV7YZQ1_9BACT
MKTIKITFLALALSGYAATAQDTKTDKHTLEIKIPEVAILDIESTGESNAISLAATAPIEAGNALDFSKALNTDLWINYSSIVGKKSDPTREVTVQVTSGTIPSGIEILVAAAKDAGQGEGKVGSPVDELILSTAPQKIITEVGSAYTGNGPKRGHNLTYKLQQKKDAYGEIDFDQSGSLTVVYTLSDK